MATTMYAKKEQTEAALLAANQIKKATLNAAKGLSRVQAERVAAAAARNVNAYGQKEEGPSRWQERKEAKRQMYLMSTEKAVKLGVRKDNKSVTRESLRASVKCQQIQCQRCFQGGHWTFECRNERVYVSRPSRTQILQNPASQRPLLELCDPLPTTNREVEVEIQQNFKSTTFANLEESKGSQSNQSPPRKSDLRSRKRRRSKKNSSSESSSEKSPSKSDSESEQSSSSSEPPSSTTYSSSTMSSPSRTTSSSRKSSSFSSVDPPTPESESEDRPQDGTINMLTHPNSPANEGLVDQESTRTGRQSQSLTSLSICTFERRKSRKEKRTRSLEGQSTYE